MKTSKMRPCKHGERNATTGKCPSKPKTRKMRPCKHGERNATTGKCPTKPKTRKMRPCKNGERNATTGKCPRKSKRVEETRVEEEALPTIMDKEIEVMIYEDDNQGSFDRYSGNELSSITDYLVGMLGIEEENIQYRGDEDERMVIRNMKYNNSTKTIGNGRNQYPVDQKIHAKLQNYGVNQWGKIEFMFKVV